MARNRTRVQKAIGIPEPTNKPDSLWRTTQALKEAVEVIQGIRGNREYALLCDLEDTNTFVNNVLGAGSGVDTFFDLTDTDLTGQVQYDLAFNADGTNWEVTGSNLHWVPNSYLELGTDIAINWVDSAAASVEMLVLASTPDTGDVYYDDVVLLAKFDGADAATAYTELARSEVGIFLADAQLDTAVQAAGTASLLVDGTGDVVQFGPDAATATAYNIGAAGTATVEGFVSLASLPAASQRMAIIAQDAADLASFFVEIYNNAGTYQLRADFGRGNFTNTAITITPSINQMYHFAVQFVANSYMEFMWTEYNGVGSIGAAMTNYAFIAKQGTGPETLASIGPIMTIGGRTDGTVSREFDGNIDSIRFTNGTRRYTSAGNRLVPDPDYPTFGLTPGVDEFIVGDPGYTTNIEGSPVLINGLPIDTNATHTGEVIGATALTLDVTAITNRDDVVADAADDVAIHDDTDGTLKKVNLSSITDGGNF
jgi:hypothetical protein